MWRGVQPSWIWTMCLRKSGFGEIMINREDVSKRPRKTSATGASHLPGSDSSCFRCFHILSILKTIFHHQRAVGDLGYMWMYEPRIYYALLIGVGLSDNDPVNHTDYFMCVGRYSHPLVEKWITAQGLYLCEVKRVLQTMKFTSGKVVFKIPQNMDMSKK